MTRTKICIHGHGEFTTKDCYACNKIRKEWYQCMMEMSRLLASRGFTVDYRRNTKFMTVCAPSGEESHESSTQLSAAS